MGIPSYSGNIEKAKALGIEASKTQNLDLKKEELAILEELFHAHSAEYAPGLLYILAESWNTFCKMLKSQNKFDNYALAQTFVKYRASYYKGGRITPKSWEFVSFLIEKKLKDNNWPPLEKLIEEATHDFQKPTLDYIIVDLKTFSAENVLRMRPMLKKLSESENFYTRPSFVSYGHKNDFGRRAKEC